HQTQAQHTVVPTREGYDRWSPVYDGDGNPLVALEERYVRPMLGNLRGLRVADVGCGTGRHALRMAREGAVVTGLDFSGGMLEQARSKASDPSHGPLPVSFIEHDLSRPLPLEDSAFDRVLCALVLDHIQDVQSLMAEFRRICAPSGFILISVMHPAMMLRGVQARFDDTATGGKTLPASVPNLVSDYVMGAVRAGLSIEAMHEHAADAELVRQAPRAEKHLGWPMLLVMKLRRGG
ncbi:MAG: class I SAM-dependent methyltransferase, partial [Phycisphaerales bacterium]